MKDKKTFIIAEAGVNHNGSLETAKRLVYEAKNAGADAVKFQTFKAEKLVSKNAQKAEYQTKNTPADESQFEMIKKLQLSENDHLELLNYSNQIGIMFLSSPFDNESIDFLDEIGIQIFKIPSGEITNKFYLQRIAEKKKQVILSSGMSDLEEIKAAIDVLSQGGLPPERLTVLHCNTEYPTPMNDVNLQAMLTIQNVFNVNVGYSDHTVGIEIAIAAVALGAAVIEKHFTLDCNMPGPDHKASLEPLELKKMVEAIRNVELAISGDGQKKATPSEMKNKTVARKSLHLLNNLPAGHLLALEDFIALRPGDGISPMDIDMVLNKILKNDCPESHKLSWSDLS